jgi:hypothetical protein
MKSKLLLVALTLALTTQGFECINEDLLVSIDVKGITGTYNVNPGDGQFNDCTTLLSTDYLDPDFTSIKDVRIYDIRISTVGTYTATIAGNSRVTVNGQTILTLVGGTQWSYFSTPKSILTDPNIVRVPAGILTLVNAIKAKQNVTICGVGSISPAPVPTGLALKVEVYGQVDAEVGGSTQ